MVRLDGGVSPHVDGAQPPRSRTVVRPAQRLLGERKLRQDREDLGPQDGADGPRAQGLSREPHI